MHRPQSTLLALTTLSLLGLNACRDAELGDREPSTSAGSQGLFVLSHSFGEPGVQVSGQVFAWSGRSETGQSEALHAVVLPEQAWLLEPGPGPDTCRAIGAHRALSPSFRIDLLDVGEVRVHPPAPLDGTALRLPPRDLPPVLPRLAGVVYDADAPEALPFLAGGRYRLVADGGEAAALGATVEAPPVVWLIAPAFGAEGLTVRWGGAEQARIFLSRDVGADTVGIECNGEGGQVLVPAELLAGLGAGPAELSVSTRKLSAWSGAGAGMLLFVARDGREVRIPASDAEPGPRDSIESIAEMREEALP